MEIYILVILIIDVEVVNANAEPVDMQLYFGQNLLTHMSLIV